MTTPGGVALKPLRGIEQRSDRPPPDLEQEARAEAVGIVGCRGSHMPSLRVVRVDRGRSQRGVRDGVEAVGTSSFDAAKSRADDFQV